MPRWRGLLRTTVVILAPVTVAVTGVSALAYGLVQQDLRQGANDPQVALAEDAARRLDGGVAPGAVVPATKVDAARSLDSFVMVFDDRGRLVASSVTVDGNPPDYPAGVFASVRQGGEETLTWQPRPGVRIASVATRYRSGFVVTGRSLRLVEARIDDLGRLAAAIWLLTLGGTAIVAARFTR